MVISSKWRTIKGAWFLRKKEMESKRMMWIWIDSCELLISLGSKGDSLKNIDREGRNGVIWNMYFLFIMLNGIEGI